MTRVQVRDLFSWKQKKQEPLEAYPARGIERPSKADESMTTMREVDFSPGRNRVFDVASSVNA